MNLRYRIGLMTAGRIAFLAIVTVVGLTTVGSAQAAPVSHPPEIVISPSARDASLAASGDAKPCFYTFPDCTSSDPHAGFEVTSDGDTSACTFQTTVDWGDNTPSTTQTYPGGADGSVLATFDHAYADPGVYSLSVTNETTVGTCGNFGDVTFQFTLTACPDKRLSGPSWASKFPQSKSVSDLSGTFRDDVTKFIAAMRAAGIHVGVIATLRPPERAYLMHYSWLIAKKQIDPLDVPDFVPGPGQQSVDICWVHTNASGEDLAASVAAARQMVSAFGIDPKLKVPPALNSLHTQGLAIDMTTTWSKAKITIINGSGHAVTIDTTPHSGLNRQLESVGKTYGVIHFLNAAKDPNHWSVNGH